MPRPRPAHWLPHEPCVAVMPPTGDGFCEVCLELAGRVAATWVADPAGLASWFAGREFFRKAIERAAGPGAPAGAPADEADVLPFRPSQPSRPDPAGSGAPGGAPGGSPGGAA